MKAAPDTTVHSHSSVQVARPVLLYEPCPNDHPHMQPIYQSTIIMQRLMQCTLLDFLQLHRCGAYLDIFQLFWEISLKEKWRSNWLCIRMLWNIVQICTSRKISADDVAYLRVLIEDHHKLFAKIYPEASIIPKMHYLIHVPDDMLR